MNPMMGGMKGMFGNGMMGGPNGTNPNNVAMQLERMEHQYEKMRWDDERKRHEEKMQMEQQMADRERQRAMEQQIMNLANRPQPPPPQPPQPQIPPWMWNNPQNNDNGRAFDMMN